MSDEKTLGHEIKKVSNLYKRKMDKCFNVNLNTNQRFILNYIIDNFKKGNDVFQKDIEKEFNIRRSTATVILQTLEKNGHINREIVSYDARLKKIVPVFIFDKKEFKEAVKKVENIATKGLAKEEIKEFEKILKKIKTNLEESEM